MDEIKVSVCVVAYNHEKFIRTCLQSIVDQHVSFRMEVLVGDDASTDNTGSIIEEFSKKYPDVITYIAHEKNIGVTENYQHLHRKARGLYVAHCDGDDYFLPGKLQTQADYLDKHSDCVQVWHRQRVVNKDGEIIGQFPYRFAPSLLTYKLRQKDLAISYGLGGQHSSQMYRRSARTKYDETKPRLDYFYMLDIASKGYSTHLNKFLGCYRVVNNGSITTTNVGKKVVETALAETALYYTNECNLGKQFYGNLWVRRLSNVYNKTLTTPELQAAIKDLAKHKSVWYIMKSLRAHFLSHSSLNFFKIVPRYLKAIWKQMKSR